MASQRDFYEVLGVKRDASADEIRSAYRKLARQFHPDVNKDPKAAERFSEVTEAYDVLADAEKRKQYDRFGRSGVGGSARQGAGAGPGGARTYTWTAGPQGADGDFGDIFEQFFGGAGTRSPFGGGFGKQTASPGASSKPRSQRGSDVQHTLTVTFMTAALGGTETLRAELTGGGSETIEVKIPPGIESGSKLRIKGKGHPSPSGQPGDLILTVQISPHPYFQRDGLDVIIDVPITIAEATLGTKVSVPLLKGSVDLTIPSGASSGQKLRIRGKGIQGAQGKQGDFYAVIQIVAPPSDSLSDEGRKSLEQLSKELPSPRTGEPWT